MNFTHKKSLSLLINNPQITLFLVLYLLFAGIIMPNIFFAKTQTAFFTFSFLLLMFTTAFFSGWFGYIKSSVISKSDTPETMMQNTKFGFFGSIPVYFFPVLFLILLVLFFQFQIPNVASTIFGKPDAILMQIASLTNDKDAIVNFLMTLPDTQRKMLMERSFFIIISSVIFYLLFFYSAPALYFNKKPNFVLGIFENFKALFKKLPQTIFLFLMILSIHIFLLFFEVVSASYSQLLMFAALVLRVCFIAYVVVLIFSIYEANFSNNGPDSLG